MSRNRCGRFVETSLPGDAGRDAPTARPQRGKLGNVANVEVLPITNTISQCPPCGNDPAPELGTGNIGTGNISTMATLNGRCQPSGSLSGAGGIGGLLAVAVTDCVATNSAFCILHSAYRAVMFLETKAGYKQNDYVFLRWHESGTWRRCYKLKGNNYSDTNWEKIE